MELKNRQSAERVALGVVNLNVKDGLRDAERRLRGEKRAARAGRDRSDRTEKARRDERAARQFPHGFAGGIVPSGAAAALACREGKLTPPPPVVQVNPGVKAITCTPPPVPPPTRFPHHQLLGYKESVRGGSVGKSTARQGSVGSNSSAGSASEATPGPPPSPESAGRPPLPRRGLTPFSVPNLAFSPTTGELKAAAASPRHLIPPQHKTPHYGKLTVVFDLDETLVSNRRPGVAPAQTRHYLNHMFQLLRGLVEVVLWTASTPQTGQPVVQQIDPHGEFFHHVVYRHDGWFTEGTHTKDLKLLGRDMDKVIIVENTPNCCKFNPQNAILVEDFVGDHSKPDRTLLSVAQIIRGAVESANRKIGVP
eukprot:gene3649-5677_t